MRELKQGPIIGEIFNILLSHDLISVHWLILELLLLVAEEHLELEILGLEETE